MSDPKDECVDCAKLPHKPTGPYAPPHGIEYRSKPPRKIYPKSRETHKTQPRCGKHWRAWDRARKTREADKRRRDTYGLTPEERAACIALQGGVDPISGRTLDGYRENKSTRPRKTATDHDHSCCEKPPTCGECTRGIVDGWTNRELIARLEQMPGGGLAAAQRLVDYFTDPPMARVRRARTERSA